MKPRNQQVVEKLIAESELMCVLIGSMTEKDFLVDERTKRAVCMTLINIGELIKNLDEEFRLKHREIPWKLIAGLRDVTAHKYQTLKMEDIWVTATTDVPHLRQQLVAILQDEC